MFFKMMMALTLMNFQSAFASKLHSAHEVAKKPGLAPCGLLGSVEDRIAECKKAGAKAHGSFVLVARTQESNEVYLDESTGVLWGDVLKQKMSHKFAMQACRDNLAEVGRIAGKNWRLPTIDEVKKARANFNKDKSKHEFMKPLPLPNMSEYQWTSSPSKNFPKQMQAYEADIYVTESQASEFRVRCVAAD